MRSGVVLVPESGPVRCLSFHAAYACRNSGVCCASGWQIAVEETVQVRLDAGLPGVSARLPNGPEGFQPMADPPKGCRSSLRRSGASGSCWFRDESDQRCAIHRELGEDALPSACRQFPRVCVLEPEDVSVSLSHYCPTAAGLLFEEAGEFRVVTNPGAFPKAWPFEGLDVTRAYPPFLRPGVLLGFDGLRAFEDAAVLVLSAADVWSALAAIESGVEASRSWTVRKGPLPDLIRSSFGLDPRPSGAEPVDPRPALLASVAEGTRPEPGLPPFLSRPMVISQVANLALRKYLASRLIAAWIPFQADDLRATAAYLRLCLDTALLFARAAGPDEPTAAHWKEAIRSADLWILHHCDPERLARNLG